MNAPLGFIIRILSEKQRRKALAGSDVKVKGIDVIASHKVICSLVAYPIAWVVWTIGFRLLLIYFHLVRGRWLNLVTVVYFILWPLYCYGMVKSADFAKRHFRSVKARFVLVFFRSRVNQLKETRTKLHEQIFEWVNTKAASLIDENFVFFEDGELSAEKEPKMRKKSTAIVEDKMNEAFEILEEGDF